MSTPVGEKPKGGSAELHVGPWRVDRGRNEVASGGKSTRLEPKAIEVLAYLAARPGQVVSREELLAAVWPGVIVGDDALTQAIIKLRKALGDDAHQPRYIETISKRGYRLIALVVEGPEAAASIPGRATSRKRLAFRIGVGTAVVLTGVVLVLPFVAKHVPMPWPIALDTRGRIDAAMPLVAVLPLANLSEDPKRDYFSDGLTEDIIHALGRFSGVRVMALNAVQGYRGKSPAAQAIQSEIGARYVVQGSVRQADGRLRVAVALNDAEKGVQLWSERYEGEGGQVFEIQDRIAKDIVGALHVKLRQIEQQRAFAKPTDNLEAYDLVLRARSLLNRLDRRSNREARALLARAAEISPEFAEVWILMGEAELQRGLYGWVEDPSEPLGRADALARRALAAPDSRTHARAHALISKVHSNLGRAHEALDPAQRAVELNPSDSAALFWRGVVLLYAGRTQEGIAIMESARRLDPQLNESNGLNLVMGYYVSERYQESLALADLLLARFPQDVSLHIARTALLVQLGDAEGARQAAQQVRRLSPSFDVKYAGSRFVLEAHREKLREALRSAGL